MTKRCECGRVLEVKNGVLLGLAVSEAQREWGRTNGARGHERRCKFVWRKGVLCGDALYWLTTKGGKNIRPRALQHFTASFYRDDVLPTEGAQAGEGGE